MALTEQGLNAIVYTVCLILIFIVFTSRILMGTSKILLLRRRYVHPGKSTGWVQECRALSNKILHECFYLQIVFHLSTFGRTNLILIHYSSAPCIFVALYKHPLPIILWQADKSILLAYRENCFLPQYKTCVDTRDTRFMMIYNIIMGERKFQ